MPLVMVRLMMLCGALSLTSCATTPAQVDSFCQIYNPVVAQKGDGAIVATEGVKRRLLANELTYNQICRKPT
jgi:hypothetical protein